MDRRTADAYRATCEAVGNRHGWHRSTLGCHPESEALIYEVDSVHWIGICLLCLQSHVGTAAGVFSTPSHSEGHRQCRQCGARARAEDFVSRTGSLTNFCVTCRTAWGKTKRAEAARAAEATNQEIARLRKKALAGGMSHIEEELGD